MGLLHSALLGNFSRQPLRTFHCLSDFSKDATNWTGSCACDEFVSMCAPPAVLRMPWFVHVQPAVLCMCSTPGCCPAAQHGKNLHYCKSEEIGKTFVCPFSIILTLKKNRKIYIKNIIEKSLFLSSSL